MLDSIQQLEQEIELFHKNVSESDQLIASLQSTIKLLQKQCSVQDAVIEEMQSLPMQVQSASAEEDRRLAESLQALYQKAQTDQQQEYNTVLHKLEAYDKSAGIVKAELQGIAKDLSGFQDAMTAAYQTGSVQLQQALSTQINTLLLDVQGKLQQYTLMQNAMVKDIADVKVSEANLTAALLDIHKRTTALEYTITNILTEENDKQIRAIERQSELLSMQLQEEKNASRKRFWILLAVMIVLTALIVVLLFAAGLGGSTSVRSAQLMPDTLGAIGNPDAQLRIPRGYVGTLSKGNPEGNGTYEWDDGTVYEGEWQGGKANGTGVFTCTAYKLEGEFSDNQLVSGNDTVYVQNAEVVFPVKDGRVDYSQVQVTFSDETVYTGTWDQGISGEGEVSFSNGDSYQGSVHDGMLNGQGTYNWTNGASYQGAWEANRMHGEGTYYYTAAHDRYISGSFVDDLPDGTLTYKYQKHSYTTTWADGECTGIAY